MCRCFDPLSLLELLKLPPPAPHPWGPRDEGDQLQGHVILQQQVVHHGHVEPGQLVDDHPQDGYRSHGDLEGAFLVIAVCVLFLGHVDPLFFVDLLDHAVLVGDGVEVQALAVAVVAELEDEIPEGFDGVVVEQQPLEEVHQDGLVVVVHVSDGRHFAQLGLAERVDLLLPHLDDQQLMHNYRKLLEGVQGLVHKLVLLAIDVVVGLDVQFLHHLPLRFPFRASKAFERDRL
mmetsp:Transcript_150283/g.262609  ORF Transcript_150283/g.262609 Transcript_150283/m.262609 type:complete len:232 (-) Transcript_150283:19-714(-)